ncbi:MAG TPA: NAD(P)/FAD-dependent oxidoreductase [Candidatus Binatia bacterium]|nr:NAD(P)/FAD-dependent oxidoreductase [Candidatus Binatia bacterium]
MKAQKNQPADVIVVGAGPVGSYVALNLAKLSVGTTVFEEHPTIGVPSHCAGHISIRSLKSMGLYPLPEGIVENTFSAANFHSPLGTKFSLKLSSPVTAVLNRARFDQYLAKKAQMAGASFVLNSPIQSLLIEDGSVKGVRIGKEGAEEKVYSEIVVDAEGVSSRLLRQTRLRALKSSSLVYAVEAEVEGVQDVELNAVEVYFGRAYSPGFYGWLIPRPDGSAKVGLATNNGNPREYLKRLMFKHPVASKQLGKAKILQVGYHAITLGGPINKSYSDGFLAVGDCASQVKPTTGGGVIFGLTCAKTAAEVASQALKRGDVSSSFLQKYQKQCEGQLSFDFRVMLRLRRFLDLLSDEKIDELLRVCGKLGVDKALRDADEIDFQGKLLLTAMKKPAMVAALAYFGLLYLSANP